MTLETIKFTFHSISLLFSRRMSAPEKKRYRSGAEKRKKHLENARKLNDEIKKTPSLFQLGFTAKLAENQSETSPSTSVNDVIAVRLPPEQMIENNDAAQLLNETKPEVSEEKIELMHRNRNTLGPEYQNDIGLWRNITNDAKDFWCNRDPAECQHFDDDFSASSRQYEDRKRNFVQSMIFRKHVSGEKIKREWLMYSPSTGSVYCFPCILFGETHNSRTQFSDGFSDWKNASQRMKMHEDSETHRACVQTMIKRRRAHGNGRINSSLESQFNQEKEYWMKVLERVVTVIKFLSSRGLAFRGDTELLGCQHNGNYLGILELIAQYDPFLSAHLAKYGNQGRGKPSYLSSTICEEVIEIMGNEVLNIIVKEIQEAKYFSLSVDSTPDISHIDQLTIVLRYVRVSDGEVLERFLQFIPISSHTGAALATTVLTFFDKCGIEIKNLRGQSYDNAANMSGCYNGLQAHIAKINHHAHYIPCAAHSLNLVGVCAAESCTGATSFFGLVQEIYNFFSASTHRWGVMHKYLHNKDGGTSEGKQGSALVVKRASATRWCARADATKALSRGYNSFQKALQVIAEDGTQKPETIHEAKCLLNKMAMKESVIMVGFWAAILERINGVSKSLQKDTIELQTAVDLLKSLLDFLASQREMFDDYERKANEMTNVSEEYADQHKRVRKRKRQYNDGDAEEVVLEGREKFRCETYLPVIDKLCAELSRRMDAYNKVQHIFGFLVVFPSMTDVDIKETAQKFAESYPEDIELEFADEMVHFKYFISQVEKSEKTMPASQSYKLIFENMAQATFPNVMTALKMYRCLMITNATGERSFSKLKLLKNCHRSSMAQERLNLLAVMACEYDVLEKLDFQDVLKEFAIKKIRKVNI